MIDTLKTRNEPPKLRIEKKNFFLLSILIVTVSFPEPSTILFLIYYLKIRYPHIFSQIITTYPFAESIEYSFMFI